MPFILPSHKRSCCSSSCSHCAARLCATSSPLQRLVPPLHTHSCRRYRSSLRPCTTPKPFISPLHLPQTPSPPCTVAAAEAGAPVMAPPLPFSKAPPQCSYLSPALPPPPAHSCSSSSSGAGCGASSGGGHPGPGAACGGIRVLPGGGCGKCGDRDEPGGCGQVVQGRELHAEVSECYLAVGVESVCKSVKISCPKVCKRALTGAAIRSCPCQQLL